MVALDHVQIAMPAGRESEARAFFRDLLGLEEIAKPAALTGRGGCWFALGAHQLHLGVEDGFRPARKAYVALAVSDLNALRTRLQDAGYAVLDDQPIEGRRRFFSEDCFGSRIEFLQLDRLM